MKILFLILPALLGCLVSLCGCSQAATPEADAAADASGSLQMAGPHIAGASRRLAVAERGAEAGRWTADLSAAQQLAAEKRLPILYFFNGSDWSIAANSFIANVLESPQWRDFSGQLVLVMLDFPRYDSGFPAALRQRNENLRKQFGVADFPTVLLANVDGAPVANLRANALAEPAQFIRDVKLCIRRLPHKIDELVASAGNAELTQRYARFKALRQKKQELTAAYGRQMAQCDQEIAELAAALNRELLEWSIAQLPDDRQEQGRNALADQDEASRQLRALLAKQPPENAEHLRELQQRIEAAQRVIDRLIVE